MNLDLFQLLGSTNTAVEPMVVVASLGVALILSGIVYGTYKMTFSGVVYSKKFNTTLVMLTMITAVVMNTISTNLVLAIGALALLRVLSLVRYRTAVKDPRDTAYILWAVCIGLSAGTGNYFLSTIGTLTIAILVFALNFRMRGDETFLIIVKTKAESVKKVRAALMPLCQNCQLRSETISDDYLEVVYQIKMKNDAEITAYEEVKKIKGVQTVNLVAQNGEIIG